MNKKEWTIMLYMAGDNNLAVNMAYAMGQLKEFAKEANGKLNLFVYYDGNSPAAPTLYCDFSGQAAKYYRSHLIADKPFKVVESTNNENAADPASLLSFVDWCVNKRRGRAERYAFILSGHSLGFIGEGLFRDETANKSMNLRDLMYALDRMTADQHSLAAINANLPELSKFNPWDDDKYGERYLLGEDIPELLGQPLDILGFDSCVMGMYEIGSQFRHCAKTMIVSEGSIPSAGWTYAKLLRDLCQDSSKTTEELAAELVEEYIKGQSEFVIGGISVDMAAWEMSQFIDLQLAIAGLSSNLLKCFSDPHHLLYHHLERAILQVHWKCQSYMYDQNVDLGDFCALLAQECDYLQEKLMGVDASGFLNDVKLRCGEVIVALQKVVIQSGFSGGSYQYSNGISIFFPWSLEAYEAAMKDYNSLWVTTEARGMSEATGGSLRPWSDFLLTYLRDVSRRNFKDYLANSLLRKNFRKLETVQFADQQQTALGSSIRQPGVAETRQPDVAETRQPDVAETRQPDVAETRMVSSGINAQFNHLKLWKNIEVPYDAAGLTKS